LLPRRPRVGGLQLRPFTLWTLDFCDELGLSYFVDPKTAAAREASPLTRLEQLSALVWGHRADLSPDEIDDHLFAGTWLTAVRDYHRRGAPGADAVALGQYIAYIAGLIGAASVKVRPRKREKGEKPVKEPVDLLHPAGRCALIWSVSGGQMMGDDQFRYLYREMPLPVLLQFYHAACREAQLLTVRPGRREPGKLTAAKDKALAAAAVPPPSVAADFF
jgi:hypothetical protein